jgi:hypothetical protein
LKIAALVVELGFEDYFWDRWDAVFVNVFSVSSSLCALKMLASGVVVGFLYDFWVLET